MSLNERIERMNKINMALAIENDQIDIAAFPERRNQVMTFTPVDEELIREYDEEHNPMSGKTILPVNEPDFVAMPEEVRPFTNQQLIDLQRKKTKYSRMIRAMNINLKQKNKILDTLKERINEGKMTMVEGEKRIKKVRKEIPDLIEQINFMRTQLNILEQQETRRDQAVKEYDRLSTIAKQKNKEEADFYVKELALLNKGKFNTERMPNETDQEYFERYRTIAHQVEPEFRIERQKEANTAKFRMKLKELIRKNSLIENVANSLNIEQKTNILKTWAEFKRKFEKKFGIFNTNVTENDVLSFVNDLYMPKEGTEDYFEYISKPLKTFERIQTPPKSGDEAISNLTNALDLPVEWDDVERQILKEYEMMKEMTKEKKKEMTKENKQTQFEMPKRKPEMIKLLSEWGIEIPKNAKVQTLKDLIEKHQSTEGGVEESKGGKGVSGFGVQVKIWDKFVRFGNVSINPNELFYKNRLVVRDHAQRPINGFPVANVSERLVNILMNLLDGKHPSTSQLHSLDSFEAELYDRLIYKANLHKHTSTRHTNTENINHLKDRLKLVSGEIKIGNDNPMARRELKKILFSLKDHNAITIPQINNYMKSL